MGLENKKGLKNQIQTVINSVNEKKRKDNHAFYDTLLNRLQHLLKVLEEKNKVDQDVNLNGALRAYFDTDLVKSYDEPLVIELDKLESMLK